MQEVQVEENNSQMFVKKSSSCPFEKGPFLEGCAGFQMLESDSATTGKQTKVRIHRLGFEKHVFKSMN